MRQHPADERSHDDTIREARTRLRTVEKLAEHYCNTSPPEFGPNSAAAGLRQRWSEELVPAAEELYECSRRLLQQLPYAAYQDLPEGPRGVLSESQDLAQDLADNAQHLAQTPSPKTGDRQLNDQIAAFTAHMGGLMQDMGHSTSAKNGALAQQARAEQQQGGDQS